MRVATIGRSAAIASSSTIPKLSSPSAGEQTMSAARLHASLALRLTGDLVDELARWRVWGGLLNAASLALFLVNTVSAIVVVRPERADLRVSRGRRNHV